MITVRRATPGDAPAIGRTHAAAWRSTYAHLGDAFLKSIVDDERVELWTRILTSDEDSRTFVACDESDAVVAFVNIRGSRDESAPAETGEVVSIYALESAWGTGAGRALMAAAVDELRALGFTDAILWVLDSNPRARRFYELAGWTLDGAEKDEVWRGAELHEVRYRRSL